MMGRPMFGRPVMAVLLSGHLSDQSESLNTLILTPPIMKRTPFKRAYMYLFFY